MTDTEQIPASRVGRMVDKILVENDDIDFVAITTRPNFYAVSFQTTDLDGFTRLRARLIQNDGYDLPLVPTDRGALSQLHASTGHLGTDARLAVHLVTIVPSETLRVMGLLP